MAEVEFGMSATTSDGAGDTAIIRRGELLWLVCRDNTAIPVGTSDGGDS